MNTCDICKNKEGTLSSRQVVDGKMIEFHICEDCYRNILASGKTIQQVMTEKVEQIGKVCTTCGWTIEKYKETMLFGCPNCYREMRAFAINEVASLQNSTRHVGKKYDTSE